MSTVSVESGVCLGFGGTNARRAVCEKGDIAGFTSVETPNKPREFFGWMARQVLQAADGGHRWLVAGYPGPVSLDGKLVGPLANVSGMAEQRYDLRSELVASDPAVGTLLRDGFVLLGVNDGNLAAHAAAERVGGHKYRKTGALIIGTGIGSGVVEKDTRYDNVHHADNTNPYEIGHLATGDNPFETYERRYSGPALAERYGCDTRDMDASHPAWRDLGCAAGRLVTTLGLMSDVNLVVPTGGVGAGASNKYGTHLADFLADWADYGNGTQKLFTPDVRFVDPSECQVFEMYGAPGVVRDHMTAAA